MRNQLKNQHPYNFTIVGFRNGDCSLPRQLPAMFLEDWPEPIPLIWW